MKKQVYKITIGETGNECGHVTSSGHVSDAAAVRKAKRLCAEYHASKQARVAAARAISACAKLCPGWANPGNPCRKSGGPSRG